jgi:tRNA A37 threonylcarbamoyladenosine synthetase subunit TsaC/SUA5/YrdC
MLENAPKLYKEFTDPPLTIVLADDQTQPWKVGNPFL